MRILRLVALLVAVLIAAVGCAGRSTTALLKVENPLLPGDRPDPQLFLWKDNYYLTYTAPNGIPLLKSKDLTHWSTARNAFSTPAVSVDRPLILNGRGYCHIWAPELYAVNNEKVLLTFSAVEYQTAAIPKQCPPFDGNTGIYAVTSANGPEGDFGSAPNEPFLLGVNPACEKQGSYPHTRSQKVGCPVGECDNFFRIDGSYFHEGEHTYLAYTWFSNPMPRVGDEKKKHGFNISIVEMENNQPERTRCKPVVQKISAVSPGDSALIEKLATSCASCSERLSFSKNIQDEEWVWNGTRAGIVEGASLFRRGEYVYLLFSHADYESAYYGVSWIAAKNVAGLADSNKDRLAGRYLIPSGDFAFGHGSPLIGPDGKSWLYIHHRIDNRSCRMGVGRRCERDLILSPLEFEDLHDGNGAVSIVPRRPEREESLLKSQQ